jgi:hypothetical protein
LLLVTAVTEGAPHLSPTVSASSSLQFIDEEPRKKVITELWHFFTEFLFYLTLNVHETLCVSVC